MESRDEIDTAAPVDHLPARGCCVHVSDASPHGFLGYVTGVHRDGVTVTRANGARELVMLSRRRVTVAVR